MSRVDTRLMVNSEGTRHSPPHFPPLPSTAPPPNLTFSIQINHIISQAAVDRVKLNPKAVDDILVGNVLPPGGGATVARMAALYAGFPDSTSIATVNRQCSSGLQAVASIAAAIQNGTIDIGIGAGVESMTMGYGAGAMPTSISEKVLAVPACADCMMPMGYVS